MDSFEDYLRPLDTYYWTPPPPRRVRGLGILAVFTAAVLILVSVGVALRSTPPSGPVPPNQAGYQWCCDANEIAANWTVPRILPAASGSEGVWVGVQTDSGAFFLQVGTNEFVAGSSQYQAFWSDGPLHGSPQFLGSLAAGDRVRAKLVKERSGWSVSFSDQTRAWTRTLTVDHLAPSNGDLAEWVEEDPVLVFSSKQEKLDSMARTVQATMTRLEVNGTPPQTAMIAGESFTDERGTTFSPTSLVHDGFSFLPW